MTESKRVDYNLKKGNNRRPLLRSEIEDAQMNTNSNRAAAKYLGVSPLRYARYAKLYGIYDRHANPTGKGTAKGFAKRPTSVPLREILSGKHPHYSRAKLKNRLVARGKLIEECSLCGFHEQRVTDKKIPLILTHKDGDKSNFTLDNLHLLCYNCMFLTDGAPSVAFRGKLNKIATNPLPQTEADKYDPDDTILWNTDPSEPFTNTLKNIIPTVTHKGQVVADTTIPIENDNSIQGDLSTIELTPEEIQQLHDELMKE